jgi:hypothetical protein
LVECVIVEARKFSSLMDDQILDCPSASWKRMFLTQPVLREVKTRNFSTRFNAMLTDLCCCHIIGHNIAYQAVENVEGVKMGQLPITVNHGAETTLPEFWWKDNWVEIVLDEEIER